MSLENGKKAAPRFVVSTVEKKVLFEPIDSTRVIEFFKCTKLTLLAYLPFLASTFHPRW